MPAHVRPERAEPTHGFFAGLIGVVGELLITVGVVLGLFVVWQLWWTDVEADQRHEQIVAGLDWAPVPTRTTSEHREEPPVAAKPAYGETFATYYVPVFGKSYEEPITEGVKKKEVLDPKGIGHYEKTQMPGELGNFAIAGHRTTYGKPFNKIADLKSGDALVVRMSDTWYVYKVTSHEIVSPKDFDVVSPVPDTKFGDPNVKRDKRYITMTACHPMFSAKERYIVHGELDYWAPTSEGIPAELADAGVQVTAGKGNSTAASAGAAASNGAN